jgi:uncharacterized protein (DUF1697 family)
MASHVALWRAVNLGKTGKLAMADLRALLEELKLRDAMTLLQSGNAVFSATASSATLEKKLEVACASRLGLTTEIFVRTVDEWSKIIEGNPFSTMAERDPAHLVVMVLRGQPDAAAVAELRKSGPEELELGDGCLYITYPNGIGRSKLNQHRAWKRLGASGTGRNWNTVSKIAAALG